MSDLLKTIATIKAWLLLTENHLKKNNESEDDIELVSNIYKAAIEALEKQVPKAVVEVNNLFECPICKGQLIYFDKFCKNCGQSIMDNSYLKEE